MRGAILHGSDGTRGGSRDAWRHGGQRRWTRWSATVTTTRVEASTSTTSIRDPLRQLERWIADAVDAGVGEPNAMTLATVDADGVRTRASCCCVASRPTSLVWFTDRRSAKGVQLARTSRTRRSCSTGSRSSVRCGCAVPVVALDDGASDAYFASRPRGSRLSAWASHQSQPTPSRDDYERQVEAVEARFAGVEEVPRPSVLGRLRAHPRQRRAVAGAPLAPPRPAAFRADGAGGWTIERLQP
jgi:pyridoxamine 5'-phosphate oxidase